jgi:hypothetical protein
MTRSIRAVTGVLVGAVLVASTATAQQGPAQRRPQQVPPTGVDAPLTPADLPGIRNLDAFTNRSIDGLTFEHRSDGTIGLDLQGRFQNVMLANRRPDGGVDLTCVSGSHDHAAVTLPQWTPGRTAGMQRLRVPSHLAAPIVVAPKAAPAPEVK